MDKHPNNVYLCMCVGELLSQLGDIVSAMTLFRKAHKLDSKSPLPFVNAARTYQQIGQLASARRHLDKAISADSSFAMSLIDMAQIHLHSGSTNSALSTLNDALYLARHMSEIKDVLIAKKMAFVQLKLEEKGISRPIFSQKNEDVSMALQ